MINKLLEKESFTFSSNWYKQNKRAYFFLLFDIFFILLLAIFSFKEYLIGNLDKNLTYDGLLFLLLMFILLIFRFNLSLLVFAKQKLGIPIAIMFILIIIYVETKYVDSTSPFIIIFNSVVYFINKFFIAVPETLANIITYVLYFYLFYAPIVIYSYYILFKLKLNTTAKPFDVFTGFYATTLSKKLRVMDVIVVSFFIAIAMWVGIISIDIKWAFLAVPLSVYSIYEFCKRIKLNTLVKGKQKLLVYTIAAILLTLIIYTQRLPYWGLAIFIFSLVAMYLLFFQFTKTHFKSLIIVTISFFIIPSLCLGYNIFAFPQYGVINNSVPFENEKIFYIIKDKDGNFGIRNRSFKIIKPAYKSIEYNTKNIILMKNQNNEWETFDLENDIFVY
jgi:hypothetical protein